MEGEEVKAISKFGTAYSNGMNRTKDRFVSETTANQQNVHADKVHDTRDWMPANRINSSTAYVVANVQNVNMGDDGSHYQTTSRVDYTSPSSVDQMHNPIAHTLREQRTSYTINNICTAGLENRELHLYDGLIDNHESNQLAKYASARTGRPGSIGDNAFTRGDHMLPASDNLNRSSKATEYGQRFRADAADSSAAYIASTDAGYAATNPVFSHPRSEGILPSAGAQYLATPRGSGFTKNTDSMPMGGLRSYETETASQFRGSPTQSYALPNESSTSGFVNGHPMSQILSMRQNEACPPQAGTDMPHLERVQNWRHSHLNQ